MARVRMLEHTADVGFEVAADTLAEVFEAAGRALLQVMFEGAPPAEAEEEVAEISLTAPDLETLMVRWLDELVFRIQTLGRVPVRTRVTLQDGGNTWTLQARLFEQPFEKVADRFATEVKATTYHGLQIARNGKGWRARVILDV